MLFAKKISLATKLGLCLVLAGCGATENPGTWNQEKVANYVKDSLVKEGLEVTEVVVTPKEGGGFEGTGTVAGGETLKLTVTQDAAAKGLEWDAVGDRGSNFGGSYSLETVK